VVGISAASVGALTVLAGRAEDTGAVSDAEVDQRVDVADAPREPAVVPTPTPVATPAPPADPAPSEEIESEPVVTPEPQPAPIPARPQQATAAPIVCPTGGIVLSLQGATSTANTNRVLFPAGEYWGITVRSQWTVESESDSPINVGHLSVEVIDLDGTKPGNGLGLGGSTNIEPRQVPNYGNYGYMSKGEWSQMAGWTYSSIGQYTTYKSADPSCANPTVTIATAFIDKGQLVVP